MARGTGVTTGSPTVEREDVADGVVLLRLNRPDRLNAMTSELMQCLLAHLQALRAEMSCRVVVLTGAGRGFSAGADINASDVENLSGVGSVWDDQKLFSETVLAIRSLPQPVIAAVNGPAAGGGLALTVACDIRYGAASARFAASFVRVGLSGGDMGTSWNLARLVGTGRAHELLLTGRVIDAEEAARIGLILDVVPDGEVVNRALQTAELIIRNSPLGVQMTKEIMWSTTQIPDLRSAIDLENRTQVLLTQTDDTKEAMRAFVEKRQPQFRRT
jgi:enoyl-CoA hydratase